MPPCRLLAFAGALVLAGCRDGAEAPPGADAPAAASSPSDVLFADGLPTGPAAPADGAPPGAHDGPPAPGVVIHPPADDAPPAAVTVRATLGSCDVGAVEPMCFAFTGPGWTAAAAQSACAEAEGGVYRTAACPTDDRIGECVYRPDGDAARETVYTFYPPMEPLIAEAVCRGTFRAL